MSALHRATRDAFPRGRQLIGVALPELDGGDARNSREQSSLRAQEAVEAKRHEAALRILEELRVVVQERQNSRRTLGGRGWVSLCLVPCKQHFHQICYYLHHAPMRLLQVLGPFFWLLFPAVASAILMLWLCGVVALLLLSCVFLVWAAYCPLFLFCCDDRVHMVQSVLSLSFRYACKGLVELRKMDLEASDTSAIATERSYLTWASAYDRYHAAITMECYWTFIFGWAIFITGGVLLGNLERDDPGASVHFTAAYVLLFVFGDIVPLYARWATTPRPSRVREAVEWRSVFYTSTLAPPESLHSGVRRLRLGDVVREFVMQEEHPAETEGLASNKFITSLLKTGHPRVAALGVTACLGVADKDLWAGMGRGLDAIVEEFERNGSDEARACLHYILHDMVGSNSTQWPHAGDVVMDSFADPAADDGRSGQTFAYFVNHPNSQKAGLLAEHVCCLRLYTTAAYRGINEPLRGIGPFADKAHPFAVTTSYLADGIRRLRAVCAENDDRNDARDFWRGMRNLDVPADFLVEGGTEFAPMSTSSNLHVALRYSDKVPRRLLFKVKTRSFIDRGADLRYLSAFPDEVEFLYPPLTYLHPTGKHDVVIAGTVEYTVVEVEPRFAS